MRKNTKKGLNELKKNYFRNSNLWGAKILVMVNMPNLQPK